ncbi:hypothetical protein C8P63_12626 [Melghirimyces profundicolus]|uniref:Uncharacterized protein n=1 Tax=Melghirimyces profundicolus TaxID=1242148 RepID=A0A2T6BCD8_9BACL|nr:hypothetical protein [Melghirimyces profundicolus]PTX53740.1 hypothetical protein C8P63_12626 [Melghirimyces profundicolus]
MNKELLLALADVLDGLTLEKHGFEVVAFWNGIYVVEDSKGNRYSISTSKGAPRPLRLLEGVGLQ